MQFFVRSMGGQKYELLRVLGKKMITSLSKKKERRKKGKRGKRGKGKGKERERKRGKAQPRVIFGNNSRSFRVQFLCEINIVHWIS